MNSETKYPFLIGKWRDKVEVEGWHLARNASCPEDTIRWVVYCAVTASHVDVFHEGIGSKRVAKGTPFKNLMFIPINIEHAIMSCNPYKEGQEKLTKLIDELKVL